VISNVVTVPPDSATRIRPSYLPESRRLVLDGTVAQGTVDSLAYAVRDPVRQSAAALARAFADAGIQATGGWRVRWAPGDPISQSAEQEETVHPVMASNGGEISNGAAASISEIAVDGQDGSVPEYFGASSEASVDGHDVETSMPVCPSDRVADCDGARRIAVIESPPLSELIGGVLEPSQNWITEQLVRAVGARFGSEGSWSEGIGVMEAYLVNEIGVDPLDIAARDGSGLSFYNLVTPRAIVRILLEMDAGPFAPEYRSAMAEPGEEDSTLETRLPELEGRLFAKTGTISNVNSLSGYLVRRDGREVVFSILSNGSGLPASQVRRAIDQIVRALAG
jgi:PBP4 family serine-type D-alanyl-D-alanine carboxypeptidase